MSPSHRRPTYRTRCTRRRMRRWRQSASSTTPTRRVSCVCYRSAPALSPPPARSPPARQPDRHFLTSSPPHIFFLQYVDLFSTLSGENAFHFIRATPPVLIISRSGCAHSGFKVPSSLEGQALPKKERRSTSGASLPKWWQRPLARLCSTNSAGLNSIGSIL